MIFFFPYNPPPPLPRQTPRPSHPEKLDFGPFRLRLAPFGLRLAPFGSVSGLFRVRFGVLGGVGVGSGRGASVREKNITTQKSSNWPLLDILMGFLTFSLTFGPIFLGCPRWHLYRAGAETLPKLSRNFPSFPERFSHWWTHKSQFWYPPQRFGSLLRMP